MRKLVFSYLLPLFLSIVLSCESNLTKNAEENLRQTIDALPANTTINTFELEANESTDFEFSVTNESDLTIEKSESTGIYCVNGSSRDANLVMIGNGSTLNIRFSKAAWSNVFEPCGNFYPSDQRFTFGSGTYQYQMVLFADAPGKRFYYTEANGSPMCRETNFFSLQTKRGWKYYVYTNDTSGDHGDNHGYIQYCYYIN